ncbi:MAG: hypothetical protein CVV44_14080 [Spirochaetae bacterium HGW-Spirochaetae-1]|nr:MAG: hypothetical protein CVV44_14080 [Spirochaetae bacterium HGW-Spirochaetae-1]
MASIWKVWQERAIAARIVTTLFRLQDTAARRKGHGITLITVMRIHLCTAAVAYAMAQVVRVPEQR